MAGELYQGAEFALAFYEVEHFWIDMALDLTFGDRVIPVLELLDGFRIDDVTDASITLNAYHGTAAGHGDFREILDAAIDRKAPADFAWTDRAATPVSMLTTKFFLKFPKNTWRITRINTGPKQSRDPLQWSITMAPKYAAYIATP